MRLTDWQIRYIFEEGIAEIITWISIRWIATIYENFETNQRYLYTIS